MSLTRQTIDALVDLVENKISCMTISDRDDLRDKVTLQRALSELSTMAGMNRDDAEGNFGFVPRRGRRRRIVTESFV